MSRRRLYLMRHAEVAYFDADGRPFHADDVPLTTEGIAQAHAAAEALRGIRFDRLITSGLARTVDTARIVAPELEPERWPELRELTGGRLEDIPEDELELAFTHAFRARVPLDTHFLAGETVGSMIDRALPAIERLIADESWDAALAVLHGGVNRAILSFGLTGERMYLGGFEQAAACINILDIGDDWIVRAVNYTPYDPVHAAGRSTTMERLLHQYLPYRTAQ